MRLIMFTVVAAAVVGLLTGGTLRDFPTVKFRDAWLALAGVVLQFIPIRGSLGTALLYASFAALITFAILNIRAQGIALILIGLALNAVVIVANQGMPVTRDALEGSNQSTTLAQLITDGGAKHHLTDDATMLLPLGDVIPLGRPFDQAISIGDICVQLGAAWFIVFSMPRRHPRTVGTKAAA
jgi:hypothetical protein